MKKLLWIGDAGCPSGFARATHRILETLSKHFDVTVLGINYRGDPHEYPYPIYAALPGGDPFGVGRLIWMCDKVKPDVILIQQDGWHVQSYMRLLRHFKEYSHIPVVVALAVDGKNFQGDWLKGVSLAVFWTEFALNEARLGGYTGEAVVIPLGVDTDIYHPLPRKEARAQRGLPDTFADAFIVGNINRNQPRKRWDLSIRYFAEWIRRDQIDNAYLFLQVAPTGDTGCEVTQLAQYYKVFERTFFIEPAMFYGYTEERLCETYNCLDVQITTTQGEGFGLTTFEGMACGIPQIGGRWASLGELCERAAMLVECTSTAVTFGVGVGEPIPNVIGGVPDEEQFIASLSQLYRDQSLRQTLSEAGLRRVHEDRFRWSNIGLRYIDVLEKVVSSVPVEVEAVG